MPDVVLGGNPSFDRRVEDIARRLIRREGAILFGPQNADARAQEYGSGLGIQNIRRGVGRAVLQGLGANITLSADSFASIQTPLYLDMVLSGRPLEVKVTGLWSVGASGLLSADINLRGASMSQSTNGVAWTTTGGILPFYGLEVDMAPAPGPARIEVVMRKGTSNGILYCDAGNRVLLTAREL